MSDKIKWLLITTTILITAVGTFSQGKINPRPGMVVRLENKKKLNGPSFNKEVASAATGIEEAYGICGVPFLKKQGQWVNDHSQRVPLGRAQLQKKGKLDANGNLLLDEVGDLHTFWVWDFHEEKDYTITARAEKKGVHCYVYVDTAESLSDDVLTNIVNEFDNKIYPTTTENFGSEWKPGIDGDTLITILTYNIKDNKYYDSSVKSFVVGYFHPKDEQPQSNIYPTSNEREMFYMDLNPTVPGSDLSYGTLAHEFQHMIHWNYDPNEKIWVNEGCSEYASFINGYPRRSLTDFLSAPDNNLIVWGSELGDYQQVFLWTLYFAEHYGGAPTIKKLVAEPQNGIDGIEQVLADLDYVDVTFSSIFSDWVIANYLDDTSIAGGKYGYEGLDLPKVSPEATYLQLPVEATSATVMGWAADYIEFWGAQDLTLNFDGGGTLPFKVRVLKLGEAISPAVVEMPLDENRDGSLALPEFGSSYDKAVLVPSLKTSLAGDYSYSAEGTSKTAFELAYDDGNPIFGYYPCAIGDKFVVVFDAQLSGTKLDSAKILFSSSGTVTFHVWDYSTQTIIGADIVPPFTLTVDKVYPNWQVVNFTSYTIDASKNFVLGFVAGSQAPHPKLMSDSSQAEPHHSFLYDQSENRWYYLQGDAMFRAYVSVPTGVSEPLVSGTDIPKTYALLQNFPNPFNSSTVIRYSIPSDRQHVSLKIYDPLGREVRTLVDESRGGGFYSIDWDGKDTYGRDVASGVYFYRLQAGNFTSAKKMIILR